MTRILAALAAAVLLACAPAAAQNVAKTPAATTLTGAEKITGAQGSGCATGVSPCQLVYITPPQVATFLTPTFQAKDADLDAIAALTTSSFGRGLLTQADAAAVRAAIGLGTLATQSGTFSGSSSGTNTGDQASVSGNAGTATKLATPRAINGVAFDGTAAITVSAVDAATPRAALSGATFTGAVNVTASGSVFAGPFRVRTGSGGAIALFDDPTNTGYFAFFKPDGTRVGYIGFGSANGELNFISDSGAGFIFAGGPMLFNSPIMAPRYCFTATVCDYSGSGTPLGVITANIGSTYHRTDGGAGTSFYVKESGNGANTGWVAK